MLSATTHTQGRQQSRAKGSHGKKTDTAGNTRAKGSHAGPPGIGRERLTGERLTWHRFAARPETIA